MTEQLTNAGSASATLPLPPGELFVWGLGQYLQPQ